LRLVKPDGPTAPELLLDDAPLLDDALELVQLAARSEPGATARKTDVADVGLRCRSVGSFLPGAFLIDMAGWA